jgi:hypothetical protein
VTTCVASTIEPLQAPPSFPLRIESNTDQGASRGEDTARLPMLAARGGAEAAAAEAIKAVATVKTVKQASRRR